MEGGGGRPAAVLEHASKDRLGIFIGPISRFVRAHQNAVAALAMFLISAAVVAHWFVNGSYRLYLDDYFPLDPAHSAYLYRYAWQADIGTGVYVPSNVILEPYTLVVLGLSYVGLALSTIQQATTAFMFGIGGVGTYFLTRLWWSRSGFPAQIGATVSGLLYMFNPVVLVPLFVTGWPLTNIAMASLPWLLYLETRGLREALNTRRIPLNWLAGAALLSIFALGVDEPFDISAIFLMIVMGCIELFNAKRGKKVALTFLVLLFVSSIVLNSFWIVPQLLYISGPGNSLGAQFGSGLFPSYQSLVYDYRFSTGPSTPLAVLAMGGFPDWQWQSTAGLYSPSSPFLAIGLLLPLLVTLPTVTSAWTIVTSRMRYLALLGSIGFVASIMMGVNSPFEVVPSFVESNSFTLQLFRVSGAALGLALVLLYSLLLGEAVFVLNEAARRRVVQSCKANDQPQRHTRRAHTSVAVTVALAAAVVLVLGVYPYPLWTGSFEPNYPPLGADVTIPGYVTDSASFLKTHAGGYSVFVLPESSGISTEASNWSHGHFGQSILAQLDEVSTIYYPSDPLSSLAYQMAGSNSSLNEFSKVLDILNVKYIVLRADAAGPFLPYDPPPQIQELRYFLSAQANITLVTVYGDYSIYLNANPLQKVTVQESGMSLDSFSSVTNILPTYKTLASLDLGPLVFKTTAMLSPNSASLDASASTNEIFGPPGVAIVVNSVPLNISPTVYPVLSVNLTTGSNTAVVAMASSRPILPSNLSFWSGDPIPLLAANAQPLPASTWAYPYYAPHPRTLTFNLGDMLTSDASYPTPSSLTILNYIVFVLWPYSNDRTLQYSQSPNQPLHIQVNSMSLQTTTEFLDPSRVNQANSAACPSSFYLCTPEPTLSVSLNRFIGASTPTTKNYATNVMANVTNGSLVASASTEAALSTPGVGLIVNSVPLRVNSADFPILSINLSTSANTAVVVMASSNGTLSTNNSFWGGDPIPLIAMNAPPLTNSTWAYPYYAPRGISLQFDLRSILTSDSDYSSGSPISSLNYIAFVLWPDLHGTTVQYSAAGNRTLGIQIQSISLGSIGEALGGGRIAPINLSSGFDPNHAVLLSGSVSPTGNDCASPVHLLETSKVSETEYTSTIAPSKCDFYVTLAQAYAPGWVLTVDGKVASHHMLGDLYANTWELNGSRLASGPVKILIEFSPQGYSTLFQDLSLIGALSFLVILAVSQLRGLAKRFCVSRPRRVADRMRSTSRAAAIPTKSLELGIESTHEPR